MSDDPIEQLWSRLWQQRLAWDQPRLRLELGGEDLPNVTRPVPRFLQAHGRACAVADSLFETRCVAVAAWHPSDMTVPIGLPAVASGFDALAATGFRASPIAAWQAPLYPDADDDVTQIWDLRAYALHGDKVDRDTLLWHAVALEMPIYPSAPLVTFLIEPVRHLMLHVYDDRGMDVVGPRDMLRPLHATFDAWLLDHDRPRMTRLFGDGCDRRN